MDSRQVASALASRFGGGLVARLAAAQALQSRQGSAEPSGASGSQEASQLPKYELGDAAGAPPAAPEPPADEEALLLTGLLNGGDGGAAVPARLLLRRRSAVQAAVEPKSSAAGSDEDDASAERPLPGGQSPSAASVGGSSWASRSVTAHSSLDACVGAAAAPDPPAVQPMPLAAAGSCRDAAEEDTVLTGSPVASCTSGSGGSLPAAEPAAGREDLQQQQQVQPPPQQQGNGAAQASGTHAEPPLPAPARRPRSAARASRMPPKQALGQQLWSFEAIPAGNACIPTCKPAAAALDGSAAKHGSPPVHGAPLPGRPAFYTRAASPPPRPAAGLPVAAAMAAAPCSARVAHESRRQRLERLAQPKRRATPVSHSQRPPVPGATATVAAGGSGPAGGFGALRRHSDSGRAGVQKKDAEVRAAELPGGGIAAWLPPAAAKAAPCAVTAGVPPPSAWAPAPASGGQHSQWPQRLGQRPEGDELAVATAAYNEERYQAHLARLVAVLERGAQRRRLQGDALAAGVTDFVAAAQGLGTGGGGGSGEDTGQPVPAAASAVNAWPVSGAASGSPPATMPLEAPAASPAAVQPRSASDGAAGAEPCGGAASPAHASLAPSPTERLLLCRDALLQARPQTAPCSGGPALDGDAGAQPTEQGARPASCLPAGSGVKSLMQVKGEQDRALQALAAARRPFRAAPLPLSTMEPRFQRQQEQAEARRADAHHQRRQQLLEAQRPFGFEARAAERAARRRLVHGQGGAAAEAATGERPSTPPFRALPVPVATLEARYALLAAELQLQRRSTKGWGSPPCRPATAAATLGRRSPGRAAVASPQAPVLQRPQTSLAAAQCSQGRSAAPEPDGPGAAASDSWPVAPIAPGCQQQCSATGVRAAAPEGPAEGGDEREAGHSCAMSASSSRADEPEPAAELAVGGDRALLLPVAAAEGSQQRARDPSSPPAPAEQQGPLAAPTAMPQPSSAGTGPCQPQQPGADGCTAAGLATVPGAGAASSEQPAWAVGRCAAAEQRAPVANAAQRGDALLPQSSMQPPQSLPERGVMADTGDAMRVQRWGTRASSCGGEPMRGDAAVGSPGAAAGAWLEEEVGIAVPVRLLPDGAAASIGAAGVGAELLPYAPAPVGAGASSPGPSAAGGSRAGHPSERRRDTPPQHIAARHAQAAAAARREVREVLERRGGSAARLALVP